nr:hypothetical protein [Tanacetum cinerariifolium]
MRMRRSARTSPLAYDPEVERSARLRRKAVRQFSTNLDFAGLKELFTEMSNDDATGAESPPRGVDSYYRPGNFKDPLPIVYPVVANGAVSNFKIQPNLIAILPVFRGHEELYAHLREFFSISNTYHVNNTTKDGVRLCLFPFSLKDQAKAWFTSLEPGSIHSWSEMQSAFLDEFYSISKTAAIRNKIKSFHQIPGERFHEAFSRLKELLRTGPHRDVPKWELVKVFYDGLDYHNQQFVMATSGANLERQMRQLAEEVHTREASKLPSYPDLNPKHKPGDPEHVNMVTSLRNGKNADNVKSDSELVNDFLKDVPKPPTQNPEATESLKDGEGGVSSTTTPYPEALEKSASARLAKKAGRSTKIPRGILEDVIVKVDDFYYPVDFFVMDTEKLRLNMFNSLNSPISNDCYHIDTIDECIQTHTPSMNLDRTLENLHYVDIEKELFDGMMFHEKEEEFQMIEEELLLSLEETHLQSQQV